MSQAALKAYLQGLVVAFVAVLLVESLARAGHSFREDFRSRDEQWFVYSPDLGWERKPGFSGSVGGFERRFDSDGYFEIDSKQITGSKPRILFLGDSNTFGWGAATRDSFAEVVETTLPGANSINAGLVGGSSYQGRIGLARYLREVKPTAIVVSYNFNDRRYVFDRSESDSAEVFASSWKAASSIQAIAARVFGVCYACRGLVAAIKGLGITDDGVSVRDVSTLVPRVDEQHYRENLAAIVNEARAESVAVVFLLLRDSPVETQYLNLGVASLERHDIPDAISKLEVAVAEDNMFSDLARVYLSRAYLAAGRETEARDVLLHTVERSLTGGRPVRLDRDYNRIMMDVAAEHGVTVVDGASVLEKHPADFVDFCHFNASAHRRVGVLLSKELSKLVGVTGVTDGGALAPRL